MPRVDVERSLVNKRCGVGRVGRLDDRVLCPDCCDENKPAQNGEPTREKREVRHGDSGVFC